MDPSLRRDMATIGNNTRPRDSLNGGAPFNGAEIDHSDHPSHATLRQGLGNPAGWGTSIWNNKAIGSSFGSTAREGSRSRENSIYQGASSGPLEGKTGSGSLFASSETDTWNRTRTRTPWGDNTAAPMPHVRSSGVSPPRKRSIAQAQPSQPFVDTSSPTFFSVARPATLAQGHVAKPSKLMLDPTSMNFTSARQNDALVNSFSNFGFSQADSNPQRTEASIGPWSDAASVHSPSEDRRSGVLSEYFASPSAAPSRSGSLPPSRHGEPVQYAPNSDFHPRYTQQNPRQHSSFSLTNGRHLQERSGSIHSDSQQTLGRVNYDNEQEAAALLSHRGSLSINGHAPPFTPSVNGVGYPRDNYADAHSFARADDNMQMNSGTYTPDSYSQRHPIEPNVQFRPVQFDSRSAPNGTAARQSPFYSHAHTPPVHDYLHPSRGDHSLSNGQSIALVQSKLAVHQQLLQERRNPTNFHTFQQPHQLQHVMAANNLAANNFGVNSARLPYYPVGVPNGTYMHNLSQNIPVHVNHGMVPVIEAPKGPRDHSHHAESVMSKCLYEFKASHNKNSQQQQQQRKQYELRDLYDHIVEFSGDQHGSRFIQNKLETANSEEKDRVFRELQGDSLQLMQDVFGNYVIQKFFEHGDQAQKKILANRMMGNVVKLSMQMYGCRVVQKALEHVLTDQQVLLVKELEKDVLNCVRDQNGNHVIQKAIERVPLVHIQFVVEAFRGNVGSLSVNTYGCRVIQRLLLHVEEPEKRFILQELHAEGSRLVADQYGNYVAQHIIEQGDPEDKTKMIELVMNDILTFSKNKHASNVVEKCLMLGTDQQRRGMMETITGMNERGESNLLMLLKDQYGNYVIQKVLGLLSRDEYEAFVEKLKPYMEEAKKMNVPSKQMMAVEKKMSRFDRVDSVSSPPPQRSSRSSATGSLAEVPALVSDAQSPQSSGLPSGNASAVEEPLHNTLVLQIKPQIKPSQTLASSASRMSN